MITRTEYRPLPAACFRPLVPELVRHGQTVRDLGELYREGLKAARDQAIVLACCRELSAGGSCDH